jgi:hypothetical protein
MDSLEKINSILYLGESSNFTASDSDSSKKSISDLISGFNQNYQIATICKGAIHASTYKLFVKRINSDSKINTVILTMNLRSFGINWIQSDLETNLSRANIIYSTYPPVFKKICLSFKIYDNQDVFKRKYEIKSHYKNDKIELINKPFKSIQDWDKDVYDKGILNKNGIKDQKQTEIACHFIKNYAFVLNENNPRVKDFDDIVSICKAKKIKLIIHLLPENIERANELCGADLSNIIKNNAYFLKRRYGKKSYFIDNSSILSDTFFIDREWPTEHYIFRGRYNIAFSINEKLKLIYQ